MERDTTEQAPCLFNIAAIEDRRERDTLGALGRTRVVGDHFVGWFISGIEAIPGYSNEPAPLKVHLAVTKAYIQNLDSLKSTNIVVKLRVNDESPDAAKMYRGVDESLYWSGSEQEVQAAFDGALADLKRQIAADLPRFCKL